MHHAPFWGRMDMPLREVQGGAEAVQIPSS